VKSESTIRLRRCDETRRNETKQKKHLLLLWLSSIIDHRPRVCLLGAAVELRVAAVASFGAINSRQQTGCDSIVATDVLRPTMIMAYTDVVELPPNQSQSHESNRKTRPLLRQSYRDTARAFLSKRP
jgi:hypothetical protein